MKRLEVQTLRGVGIHVEDVARHTGVSPRTRAACRKRGADRRSWCCGRRSIEADAAAEQGRDSRARGRDVLVGGFQAPEQSQPRAVSRRPARTRDAALQIRSGFAANNRCVPLLSRPVRRSQRGRDESARGRAPRRCTRQNTRSDSRTPRGQRRTSGHPTTACRVVWNAPRQAFLFSCSATTTSARCTKIVDAKDFPEPATGREASRSIT